MRARYWLPALYAILLAGSAQAQAPQPPAAQVEAMKKLAFLVGEWKGSGWIEMEPGRRSNFSGRERVRSSAGGIALLVEGTHTTRIPGQDEDVVVHDALGVLSYDEKGKRYRFRTWSARGDNWDAEARLVDGALQWSFQIPEAGRHIRFTIRRNEKGQWHEIGEGSTDGKTWGQFFQMTLDPASPAGRVSRSGDEELNREIGLAIGTGIQAAVTGTVEAITGLTSTWIRWGVPLGILGLVATIAGSILRARARPRERSDLLLSQLSGLPVRVTGQEDSLGTVTRVFVDRGERRVVGFQVSRGLRRRMLPWSDTQSIWEKGVIVAGEHALLRPEQAPELAALARSRASLLGRGEERRRVLSEAGALLGTTRADRVRVDVTSGELFLELLPHGIHSALQTGFSLVDSDALGWVREWLTGRGLDLAPSQFGVAVYLPARLIRSIDRKAILVSDEAAAIVAQHCQKLEEAAREHVTRVKHRVSGARSRFVRSRATSAAPGPAVETAGNEGTKSACAD